MSRETDSSSPNPPRPGADAYPSGTPPYGMPSDPAFSRAGQPQGNGLPNGAEDEPPADEPRTETTLTTRIRINIPGSRPIPPVVVRSPMPGASGTNSTSTANAMNDADGATGGAAGPVSDDNGAAGPRHRSAGSGSSPVLGVMDSSGSTAVMPDIPAEWRTHGQGTPLGAATDPGPGAAAAAEEAEPPSTWFAPRRKSANEPEPAAVAEPAAAPEPVQPEASPFQPDGYTAPTVDYGRPVYQQQPYGDAAPYGAPEPAAPSGGSGGGRPAGMNSGLIVGAPEPAVGRPQPGQPQADYGQPGYPQAPQADYGQPGYPQPEYRQPGFEQPGFAPAADPAEPTVAMPLFRAANAAPAAAPPVTGPGTAPGTGARPKAQPQAKTKGKRPAEAPAPARQPTAAPVPDGFAGGTGGAGAPPRKEAAEEAAEAKPAAVRKPPARKGRKLLMRSGILLVLAASVVYGAGLMLNQADVPKGTTVLGASIGGDTQDVAVHTLDGTVGVLAAKPLDLIVGGRKVQLSPSVAGLTIDTTATVQGVAHHSYNPISVVASLFGGDHVVAPVVKVDQAKLRAALQQLATGGSGAAHEGSIRFTADGGIVKTMPQAGQSLSVPASAELVQQAYENRAAGLIDRPITLPAAITAPQTSAATVNEAADTIGKRATKNPFFTVTIHGVSQQFGKNTFSKALTLQASADGSGKLVPVFDLAKLQSLYGTRFDNLKIKHNGVAGPVTPQDIATALTTMLEAPAKSATTVTLS